MRKYNVYIGFDKREELAAEVCKFSIAKRSKNVTDIKFLKSKDIEGYGRNYGEPQSTDFTFTRFLVPYLNDFKGISVFCDCDFLFVKNLDQLIDNVDLTNPVSVVKHPSYIPRTELKMDNIQQHRMVKKNWASLIVFNNEHSLNQILTIKHINEIYPGRLLHQFHWLSDEQIGSIPLEWNVLDDYYHLTDPAAIHYTDGGPWFDKYQDTMYSSLWKTEFEQYKQHGASLS